jgi:hypothetical protein
MRGLVKLQERAVDELHTVAQFGMSRVGLGACQCTIYRLRTTLLICSEDAQSRISDSVHS